MLSKVVVAVCGLGVLAALAVSDARPYDAHAGIQPPAPQVVAAIGEHATASPPAVQPAPAAAPSAQGNTADAPASTDTEPKNWVLIGAGVYLIGTVLRRRARSTTI